MINQVRRIPITNQAKLIAKYQATKIGIYRAKLITICSGRATMDPLVNNCYIPGHKLDPADAPWDELAPGFSKGLFKKI